MFVSVIHRISDRDRFFEMAGSIGDKMPPDLDLPLSFTSADRSTTVCLWEAPSVARVMEFLEPISKGICENEFAEVDTSRSSGLPAAAKA